MTAYRHGLTASEVGLLPVEDLDLMRPKISLHRLKGSISGEHPLSTFYIRFSGDSMVGAGVMPGALLVVDRAVEAHDGHIVLARTDDELCVKRLSMNDEGQLWLLSENAEAWIIAYQRFQQYNR